MIIQVPTKYIITGRSRVLFHHNIKPVCGIITNILYINRKSTDKKCNRNFSARRSSKPFIATTVLYIYTIRGINPAVIEYTSSNIIITDPDIFLIHMVCFLFYTVLLIFTCLPGAPKYHKYNRPYYSR